MLLVQESKACARIVFRHKRYGFDVEASIEKLHACFDLGGGDKLGKDDTDQLEQKRR